MHDDGYDGTNGNGDDEQNDAGEKENVWDDYCSDGGESGADDESGNDHDDGMATITSR